MERYDVVIAGGGIGGLGAATGLARAGLSVMVVEPTTEYPDTHLIPAEVDDTETIGGLLSSVSGL